MSIFYHFFMGAKHCIKERDTGFHILWTFFLLIPTLMVLLVHLFMKEPLTANSFLNSPFFLISLFFLSTAIGKTMNAFYIYIKPSKVGLKLTELFVNHTSLWIFIGLLLIDANNENDGHIKILVTAISIYSLWRIITVIADVRANKTLV